jgi:hypothetical protein
MKLLRVLVGVLLVAIVGLIAFVLLAIRDRTNSLSTPLSALASCLSALVALLVSHLSEARDAQRKRAERETAATAQKQKRATLAKVYKAQIDTWLSRRELSDYEAAAKDAPDQFQLASSEMRAYFLTEQGRREHAPARARTLFEQAMLRRGLSTIPDLWATQFPRDDAFVLGASAMELFVAISALWHNVMEMGSRLPAADAAARFIGQTDLDWVFMYLRQTEVFLKTLHSSFVGFRALATKAGAAFTVDTPDAFAPLVDDAKSMLAASQSSPDYGDLYKLMSWVHVAEVWKAADENLKRGLADYKVHTTALEQNIRKLRSEVEKSLSERDSTAEPTPSTEASEATPG